MNSRIAIFWILVLAIGCRQDIKNKYHDRNFIQIADYKNARQPTSLIPFLRAPEAQYRKEAALAFGSIQDSSVINYLGDLLLHDNDSEVRSAAAFAISQTRCRTSSKLLLNALKSEKNSQLRGDLLRYLGKAANTTAYQTLSQYIPANENESEGQLWGFYYSRLYGMSDQRTILKIINSLDPQNNTSRIQRAAAQYLTLLDSAEATWVAPKIRSLLASSPHHLQRPQLIQAWATGASPGDTAALHNLIRHDQNILSRHAVLKGLLQRDPRPFIRIIASALSDTVFIQQNLASDLLTNLPNRNDPALQRTINDTFTRLIQQPHHWHIHAKLLRATYLQTHDTSIFREARRQYQQQKDSAPRAAYINTLSVSAHNFQFISQELLKSKSAQVQSQCAMGLYDIMRSRSFPEKDLPELFETLKKALKINDPVVTDIICQILRYPYKPWPSIIKDMQFLYNAQQSMKEAGHLYVVQSIETTLSYFEKRPAKKIIQPRQPINWSLVAQIPSQQRIKFTTTRGSFLVHLDIDAAPQNVTRCISLVKSGYYKNQHFNFSRNNILYTSGPRNDGWETYNPAISAEYNPGLFDAGWAAMASTEKDSERSLLLLCANDAPFLSGVKSYIGQIEGTPFMLLSLTPDDYIIEASVL